MGWGLETSQVACCADTPPPKNTLKCNAGVPDKEPSDTQEAKRTILTADRRWRANKGGTKNVLVTVSVGRWLNSVRATTVQKEEIRFQL